MSYADISIDSQNGDGTPRSLFGMAEFVSFDDVVFDVWLPPSTSMQI